MIESIPAWIQSIDPDAANPKEIEVVAVKLKLSTGEEHELKLQSKDPILTQIAIGGHVLVVSMGCTSPGQRKFAIATNYGSIVPNQ